MKQDVKFNLHPVFLKIADKMELKRKKARRNNCFSGLVRFPVGGKFFYITG